MSAKREMYMKEKNSSLAILREPFIAGTDENLSPVMHHLWKLEGGAIYFCRKGWAHATIDLKDYEIVENTQVVLLPGTIIRIKVEQRLHRFVFRISKRDVHGSLYAV